MATRNLTADDVSTAAKLYGVPPELALAIWHQESGGRSNVKDSAKGAVGGFQVMPDTFKRYMPDGNIRDPVDNMYAGLAVLADGLKQSGGDPKGAAQFYYHGKVLRPGERGPTSGPGTPDTLEYSEGVMNKMVALQKLKQPENAVALKGPSPDLYGGGAAIVPTSGTQSPLDQMSPYLNTAQNEEGDQEEEPTDIAGLTRPLDLSRSGEWLGPQNQDYELDKFIRNLVDEEFKTARV